MSERVRQVTIFGLLIASLLWGGWNFFGRNSRPAADARPRVEARYSEAVSAPVLPTVSSPSGRNPSGQSQGEPAPRIEPIDRRLCAEYRRRPWGRDPFYHDFRANQTQPNEDSPRLHLLGILYQQIGAQALINGRIWKKGDAVDDYRIVEIARDHVILQNGKDTVTLWVAKASS